jgi:hypothetical protein
MFVIIKLVIARRPRRLGKKASYVVISRPRRALLRLEFGSELRSGTAIRGMPTTLKGRMAHPLKSWRGLPMKKAGALELPC